MDQISQQNIISSLVTGGNGYLGRYVVNHLLYLGWKVKTLGRSTANSYAYDLTSDQLIFKEKFDVVIHCAGKAHSFPKTSNEAKEFFDVNVQGTANLLKSIEANHLIPSSFVFISSVSVYGLMKGIDVNEQAATQSKYPYGSSKALAENLVKEWCAKHRVKCLILRLPLLAGQHPPGNLASMISVINKGYYFNLSGDARKSIVMAEDVANIIPTGASIGGIYNLTDGHHPSVSELSELIAMQLGKAKPKALPKSLGIFFLLVLKRLSFLEVDLGYKLMKLTSTLTFDDSKAKELLGWRPKKVIDHFKIR